MKTSIVQNKFMMAAALAACLTFIQVAAFGAAGGFIMTSGGSVYGGVSKDATSLQDFEHKVLKISVTVSHSFNH